MTRDDMRCVITGLGMVCAIGGNVDECWNAAINGKTGIDHTHTVDTENCYADYAAEVKIDIDDKGAEGFDRASKLCLRAAKEAVKDAGYKTFSDSDRASVIMGSCVGGVVSIEKYYTEGKKKENIAQMPISAIATQVAGAIGAGGIVTNIANACAAGTMSIAYAADLIREGKADIVVAGGADAFASVPYAGFLSLHALDELSCSPFNRSKGLTLGEGSGVVVVESYAHAKARGAKMYCEVLGSGITSDAHHITAPRPDGEGQIHAIHKALKSAGKTESDIDYVNAHGTGTPKNDEAESLSLHAVFDGKTDKLSVSSTKSMTGHCLGAAGAIEAVFSIKALTENLVPPTIGYTDADIEALKERAGAIDFVPNVPHVKELNTVMSNSFAFGGNNASIIFGKDKGDIKASVDRKKNIFITGIGAVTPFGNGGKRYIEAVKSGEKVKGKSVRSSVTTVDYDAVGLKMAFYRKLDRFSQLQAVSGMQALHDANYTVTDDNAWDIGVIVGTSEGALGPGCDFEMLIAERGNAAGSAFKFPNTVYNAAGGYLSICSGIKGYNVTVTNGAQSGLSAIAYAMTVIRSGDEKAALVGGSDENSDIIDELYNGLGYVDDGATPYAGKKTGFTLSDGSISLLVEGEESAKSRGAKRYAKLAGFGMAHKNVKFGTLVGSGAALDRAIHNALVDAGLDIKDIDAVVGFADGHKAVDSLELDSYNRVFGSGLKDVPVLSVKERMGEARAAAATLGAVHAAYMLCGEIQEDTAFYFDGNKPTRKLVKASGLKNILVTAYGSGGSYCAIIVSKA